MRTVDWHAAAPVALAAILAGVSADGQTAFRPQEGKLVLGSPSTQTLKGGREADVLLAETGRKTERGSVDGGRDKLLGSDDADLLVVGYDERVEAGAGNDRIVIALTRAPRSTIYCGKGSDRLIVERSRKVKADSVRRRLSSCEKVTFEYGSLTKLGSTGRKLTVRGTLYEAPPGVPATAAAATTAPPGTVTLPNGSTITPPAGNPFPPPPVVFSGGLQPGVQAGANVSDGLVSYVLRAPIARVEFPIATPADAVFRVVRGYARGGIRVLPLAGFHGRLPSVAEAQALGAWARAVGPASSLWTTLRRSDLAVQRIEFGNETSFAYQGTHLRGGEYALRVRDAARALAGTGVGLLVQADEANQSDRWVDQMFAAVPELASYAAGWTVHPYGPQSSWQSRIDDVILKTRAHGAPDSIPVDITEYGIATDNGRCLDKNYGWPLCLTYAQAAASLRTAVQGMWARYGSRIGLALLYNNHDLRRHGETGDAEHYFGARQSDGRRKGDYTTAVESLMMAR